ncbi:MAG: hypothetical protein MJ208_00675 [Bacilli bacterium]|nr:hypothetical protein [Bacilli bacterium]
MKIKALLLVIPLFFSCSDQHGDDPTPVIPHHSYDEVSDRVVMWQSALNVREDDYCVYFYSRVCQYCDSIRDEVIEIALTHQTPIYFCNDNEIKIDANVNPEETIGETDINSFKIKGFPSLIEVNKCQIKSHEAGRSKTINFLRNIA